MANSPQLDKYGGLVGFIWLGFLKRKKKEAKKSGTYVKNYGINSPEFLFLRPFQYPVISSVEHKENSCTFPEKTLRSSLIKEREYWMQLHKLRCS